MTKIHPAVGPWRGSEVRRTKLPPVITWSLCVLNSVNDHTAIADCSLKLVFFSHNSNSSSSGGGGDGVLSLLLLQWLTKAYANQPDNKSPQSSNLMGRCVEYDYNNFQIPGRLKKTPPLYWFNVCSRLLSVEALRPSQTVQQPRRSTQKEVT